MFEYRVGQLSNFLMPHLCFVVRACAVIPSKFHCKIHSHFLPFWVAASRVFLLLCIQLVRVCRLNSHTTQRRVENLYLWTDCIIEKNFNTHSESNSSFVKIVKNLVVNRPNLVLIQFKKIVCVYRGKLCNRHTLNFSEESQYFPLTTFFASHLDFVVWLQI